MIKITKLKKDVANIRKEYDSLLLQLNHEKEIIDLEMDKIIKSKNSLLDRERLLHTLDVICGKYSDFTPSDFIQVLCTFWKITPTQLVEKNRKDELVYKRVIVAKLLTIHFKHLSLKCISEKIGLTDHSSSIHLLKSFDDHMSKQNEKFIEVLKPVSHFFIENINKKNKTKVYD